ncbi:MAG TPA: hypothetical protein VHE09_13520 [Rhizomicrobium sp.]|nr:hypothetical protein [Rhizomicrobium sp.]
MSKMLIWGTVAAVAALYSLPAMAVKDNFDRDSLGRKWVVPNGSLFIVGNQLRGSNFSIGYDKQSRDDSTVSATLYINSTDVEYGAVLSGDIAGGNNAFVKLQNQDGDRLFEKGAFYRGNNNPDGGEIFDLKKPVSTPAKLTVSFCGTVATMTINSPEGKQRYKFDYETGFGTGGGGSPFGSISLDNYKSSSGGCAESAGANTLRIKHSTGSDPTVPK